MDYAENNKNCSCWYQVNEVKAAKEKLIEDRRSRLDMKLERAAAKRSLYLKQIMKKAHDEEEKLKEIAFINEMEARNKRHDLMLIRQEKEDRLQVPTIHFQTFP